MYSYGGFDLLFTSGTNNNPAGTNTAALRAQVFDYFNPSQNWTIIDGDGTTRPAGFTGTLTAAAGAKIDFALITTNTYSLTITPLSDPLMAYTKTGNLATNPVTWFNFRLYCGASSGLTDTSNNYSISSMTISPLTLNIQKDDTNVLLSWLGAFSNFNLVSSTNLSLPGWTAVSTTPSIVNGQNVVTNPIVGNQQFFRLQLQQ
jgi:hypothetical protein